MNRKLLNFIDSIPVGCATALIFSIIAVLTLMPSSDVPSVNIPNIDKAVHAIMFGTLSTVMLFDVARYRRHISMPLLLICATIASAIGGGLELLQGAMSMGRGAEWADLIADTLGAFLLPMLLFKPLRELTEYHTLSSSIIRNANRIPAQIEQLYVNSFPVDERRPWSEIENMTNTSQMFRFTLLRSAGKPAGFITWWKLKRGIYVEHFAISPSMRSHGLGAMALKRFCAERGNSPVILEVEPAGSEPMADRRIGFYSRCGFKLHKDFDYIQPPYAPGLNPVRLQLMTYGDIGNLSDLAREIKQEVYGAENPD